jgi:bisphosphoglycerate-independent phosphoglycerate mutase (AlkP superfamily)
MHSYLEEESNLNGFFLFDTSDKQKKTLKFNADYWDIAPSIIRCIGEEIPKFMTGTSIV